VQQYWKGLGGAGTVGIEVVLSVVVGLFGGQWLDKKFDTAPWLTVVGLLYGLAAAGRAIYRALRQSKRELEELEKKESAERKSFDDENPNRQ
jgi:F0F1-type ATP synthase assembly protein I